MRALGYPISRSIACKGAATQPILKALTILDKIHGDGVLPRIMAVRSDLTDEGAAGYYDAGNTAPWGIVLDFEAEHLELTVLHEIGHFLDDCAIGASRIFASEAHPDLHDWRLKVDASPSIIFLRSLVGVDHKRIDIGYGLRDEKIDPEFVEYYLRRQELFARSYAQFIAKMSGDPELLRQLDLKRGQRNCKLYRHQWQDDEFAPISDAFVTLFRLKRWMS